MKNLIQCMLIGKRNNRSSKDLCSLRNAHSSHKLLHVDFAVVYIFQSIKAGVGEFVVFQLLCSMLLLAFSENETPRENKVSIV
jgi:hypothetical protein